MQEPALLTDEELLTEEEERDVLLWEEELEVGGQVNTVVTVLLMLFARFGSTLMGMLPMATVACTALETQVITGVWNETANVVVVERAKDALHVTMVPATTQRESEAAAVKVNPAGTGMVVFIAALLGPAFVTETVYRAAAPPA